MEEEPVKTHPKCHNRGWTDNNTSIVEKWKTKLEERSFIYNDAAEWYERANRIIFLLSVILSLGITIASIANIIMGSVGLPPWGVLALNCGMAAAAAIVTSTNTIANFYNWEDSYEVFNLHSQKLYILWLTLNSELSVSKHHRFRASLFIQRKLGEFSYLMQQGPKIGTEDYNKSSHKWKNSNYDEDLWNLRFNKKKDNIATEV